MSKEKFSELLDVMAGIDWNELPLEGFACDGEMWEMKHYGPDGEAMQSVGTMEDIDDGILRMIALSWPEPEAA